jgi:hypothetical protein
MIFWLRLAVFAVPFTILLAALLLNLLHESGSVALAVHERVQPFETIGVIHLLSEACGTPKNQQTRLRNGGEMQNELDQAVSAG